VIRIRYLAHQRVTEPVFGLAIHRQDGLHVAGPNTLEAGLDIDVLDGPGEVRYRIARMPLLAGTYELSVSCYDRSCTHPYDYHHRRYPFRVRAESSQPRFGMLALDAAWQHHPGPEGNGSGHRQ
jgi:hypothetical protein